MKTLLCHYLVVCGFQKHFRAVSKKKIRLLTWELPYFERIPFEDTVAA